MIAFCSPWRHRQVSSPVPEGASLAHRAQPPSPQFGTPRGVSLYPVDNTMRSLTITAPTQRRRHVDRLAARCAMRLKYSSQDGLLTTPPPSESSPSILRVRTQR